MKVPEVKNIAIAGAPSPTLSDPSSSARAVLEAMPVIERLRLLLGFLSELSPASEGPERLCLHLTTGDLRCTVRRQAGKLTVEAGHQGDPSSRVVGTAEVIWKIFAAERDKESLSEAEVTASSMDELGWLISHVGVEGIAALARELEARGTGISRSAVGAVFSGDPILVTASEILEFAEATNDPNPWFVDLQRRDGIVAPPLFAIRYFNLIYARVLMDPTLKLDLGRLLFGEMELRFHAPIRPKDRVIVTSKVLSVEDKDTGQIMRLSSRLLCEGEPKVESVASFFIRWAKKIRVKRLQEAKNVQTQSENKIVFEEPMRIREDQTRLFSKAGNDPNPVHLDDAFARAAGLPGIIVHGLCSMSFCSRAFVQRVCEGDPTRLVGLKVRFSKPARPGQILTTRAFAPRVEEGLKVYSFVAINDQGEVVIIDGEARTR